MSSIIPPGQADLAFRLAQLPQSHPDDCSVLLDPLTMAGFNAAARARGTTVDDIAREAAYLWLRFFFAEEQAQQQGKQGSEPPDRNEEAGPLDLPTDSDPL
jgi:hypothetical protein